LKSRILNSGVNLINPDIVLVGQPNAGKSSLFNKLLSDNRAIVSEIAGTTRDFITEKINIFNNFYSLIDTAGLRVTSDSIEEEGIKRAYQILDKAFYKILLINPFEYDKNFFDGFALNKFDIIIFTHNDREGFENLSNIITSDLNLAGPIEPLSESSLGPIEPKPNILNGPIGANLLDESRLLVEYISFLVNKKYLLISNKEPIIIDRHIDTINKIYEKLEKYSLLHKNTKDISIISSEFNIIGHCISELIGIVSPDDVLHNIFENFCIGK
jgi:tRNA modification GTPase